MNKKTYVLIVGFILFGIFTTGCKKQQASNTEAEVNSNVDQKASNDNLIMGKVTAIDGNRITIQIGNMGGGRLQGSDGQGFPNGSENPGFPEGSDRQNIPNGSSDNDFPEKPDPSNMPSNFPEQPDGNPNQSPPPMPDGADGDPRRGGAFEETGESKDITIEEEGTLRKRNGRDVVEASLTDINIGDILSITYNQDNSEQIESVTILSMQGRQGQENNTENNGQTGSEL